MNIFDFLCIFLKIHLNTEGEGGHLTRIRIVNLLGRDGHGSTNKGLLRDQGSLQSKIQLLVNAKSKHTLTFGQDFLDIRYVNKSTMGEGKLTA